MIEGPAKKAESTPMTGGSQDKLKLLMVSGMFPSVEHAGGLRLYDILQDLAARHEVHLYSVFQESLDRASLEKLRPLLASIRLVPEAQFQIDDLDAWLKRSALAPEDFSAVLLEYPHSTALAESLKKRGARLFFTFMESVTRRKAIDFGLSVTTQPEKLPAIAKDLLDCFLTERKAMIHCESTIALTPADADYVESTFNAGRPHVVATGISPIFLAEASPVPAELGELGRSAIFVGYFDHYPNNEGMEWYLKNVHAQVLAAVPDFKLYVVGRGDTTRLKTLAQGQNSVVFVGRVESIAEWIEKARICISPLISGAGFRGKLNQYSALGRPTVSTGIGACGLPYVHGESVFKADDPAEFADAMIKLLLDDALWHDMQEKGKRVVDRHFGWPNLVQKLETIYRGKPQPRNEKSFAIESHHTH